MSENDGTYASLVQLQEPTRKPKSSSARKPRVPDSPIQPTPDDPILGELEDLSEAGYNSHSFRFTESELRWLRRFSLRLSEVLDRQISRNTLIRCLLRLAQNEWKRNPESNRLRDFLARLKN